MVTKLSGRVLLISPGSVLAKIHMVTKRVQFFSVARACSVLAKIHMVTKPVVRFFCYTRKFCSSKNSYGNKTARCSSQTILRFCSSKNSYGNKTTAKCFIILVMFCSSKNSYGNKTSKIW